MKNNLKYFTLDSFGPRPVPENWLEIISHLNTLVDQVGVPDDQGELSQFWNAYWNHEPYHGESIPFVAPVWEDWPGIPVCRAERPGFQAPASVYFNPKDRRIFWSNGDAIETDPIETLEQAEIRCKAIFPECTLYNEGERMTNMFGKEEKKMVNVSFEAGPGVGDESVNFMLGRFPQGRILVSCPYPENVMEDYGYIALKTAFLKACDDHGISRDTVSFWYDGHEDFLSDDARADVDVDVDVDF